MAVPPLRFAFDLVDPGSYLVHELLNRWRSEGLELPRFEWIPLELCPFPRPALDPLEPAWAAMTVALEREAAQSGIPLRRPPDIPRTRKAHESLLHAESLGLADGLREVLFRAHFVDGLDIGRVDVVLDLASGLDLDRGELRAVLGVDRYLPRMQELRSEAMAASIRGVPTLLWGEVRWEGFSGSDALRQFFFPIGDSGQSGVRLDDPRQES